MDYKAYFIGLCHTWMKWHDGTILLDGPKSRLLTYKKSLNSPSVVTRPFVRGQGLDKRLVGHGEGGGGKSTAISVKNIYRKRTFKFN